MKDVEKLECTLLVGRQSNAPTVLVFYCCVTNYHKQWLKTTHIYYLILSLGQKSGHSLGRGVFCLESHKTAIKVRSELVLI